jgi:hypothetical protein
MGSMALSVSAQYFKRGTRFYSHVFSKLRSYGAYFSINESKTVGIALDYIYVATGPTQFMYPSQKTTTFIVLKERAPDEIALGEA